MFVLIERGRERERTLFVVNIGVSTTWCSLLSVSWVRDRKVNEWGRLHDGISDLPTGEWDLPRHVFCRFQ